MHVMFSAFSRNMGSIAPVIALVLVRVPSVVLTEVVYMARYHRFYPTNLINGSKSVNAK